jgi:hypothetical protein
MNLLQYHICHKLNVKSPGTEPGALWWEVSMQPCEHHYGSYLISCYKWAQVLCLLDRQTQRSWNTACKILLRLTVRRWMTNFCWNLHSEILMCLVWYILHSGWYSLVWSDMVVYSLFFFLLDESQIL